MTKRWHKSWPLLVPKHFDVEKPVSEYIRDWAILQPNKIALCFYGRDITYSELNAAIDRAAWGLVGLGIKKGDRVAIHMENCPQFVIAYFGVQRAGGVVVPVNPMFKQAEIEYELNDSGAETLIGMISLYEEVRKARSTTPLKNVILTSLRDYMPATPILPIPSEVNDHTPDLAETLRFTDLIEKSQNSPICLVNDMAEDLSILQYTGGTTGIPKGAMITHYALSYVTLGTAYWYRDRDDDVHLAVAPFFHTMGQQQSMCTPLVGGGKIVILSRFIPEVVAQAIEHYGCTRWVAATTMIIALLSISDLQKYNLHSLRWLNTGGAPVSAELQKKLAEVLPGTFIAEGYGMTETLPQGGAITPIYRYRAGFVGIPQLNDAKIVDLENGAREMDPNQEGEIIFSGPAIMKGYWNRPEDTYKALKGGWLYTGDIGSMDEEGYIKLLGRKKELIKCSGYSVFPPEVEGLLYRHPAVKEAAVIGISDPYRGETPKAFIVLKSEYIRKISEEELLKWCKENIAAYKRPRIIQFCKELPKSAAGKILKRLLT